MLKWTEHALENLKSRGISKKLVEEILKNPDEIVTGKYGRTIYHKLIGNKLMRVITENNLIITVYYTSRVTKYWKGGKKE
ncbi:DUF4258 domain-containing protein [Thermosipho ferrireducens]|uniref:DUF4258 domain-containing protein n=1 Tax=Thermosipho ferrireducens TaxID=2571116 RepID=A0ABX7S8F1_9BACT|nr:DUF4258 domain-containing protein [Thermosipho ferrireducens]QTA38474.1 DUF4258 domain-containing protein [Thermosipho ferrireducens]